MLKYNRQNVLSNLKILERTLPKTISLRESGSVELFSTSAAVADIYNKKIIIKGKKCNVIKCSICSKCSTDRFPSPHQYGILKCLIK